MLTIDILNLSAAIAASVYYAIILYYFIGLGRLRPGKNRTLHTISVLIPARNEEKNIGRCLDSVLQQNYPEDLYQIHVIDDHSPDRTVEIVRSYREIYPGRIHLHRLRDFAADDKRIAYKKAAIQLGIENSRSDLIVTTDADCTVQPTWLTAINRHFSEDVGMVCGLVTFGKDTEHSLFHRLQSLEFLGLVSAAAGSMANGFPATANGANLAYRRTAFTQVNGFTGIDDLPSGDDDLLMHKIHRTGKWKIRFTAEKTGIVTTQPEPTLKAFFNQRTRWASKSTHYGNRWITAILSLIYLFYFYLTAGLIYFIFFDPHYLLPPVLFLGKWLIEFLILQKACALTGRKDLLKYFPAAQFFQILYILIAGFRGVFGKYSWKDRVTENRLGKLGK
ncbi:MAG TPA: glycosyltransferase [Bacteroidetes bacterium]|nr:glycosyltransferase [Bacteroidota bacterium]